MFEDKTYESLLAQKLAKISSSLDKREGSIIHVALAPNSFEAAMLYAALDVILNETFADTASREYLIHRCAERGIRPYPATKAKAIGCFNIDVPIGSRFSCDKYNWITTDKISTGKFHLECETVGTETARLGHLLPIEYIEGLETAELTEIVIYGEDEEDTEHLRDRYFASFTGTAYGFNRAQYIAVTKSIPGVGGCKPYRAWNGGGTVKLVISNGNNGVPSSELVSNVQTKIDPIQNSGEGLGIAPIDHEVTVVGVRGTPINIAVKITYADGYNIDNCRTQIVSAIDTYFAELNAAWDSLDMIIVRIAQIEHRLMSLTGIIDVSHTTLSTTDSSVQIGSSGNAVLDKDAIVLRGEINAT